MLENNNYLQNYTLKFIKLNNEDLQHDDQGTLVLNLAKIDWSVQDFSDFEFFENFFKIV